MMLFTVLFSSLLLHVDSVALPSDSAEARCNQACEQLDGYRCTIIDIPCATSSFKDDYLNAVCEPMWACMRTDAARFITGVQSIVHNSTGVTVDTDYSSATSSDIGSLIGCPVYDAADCAKVVKLPFQYCPICYPSDLVATASVLSTSSPTSVPPATDDKKSPSNNNAASVGLGQGPGEHASGPQTVN